MKPFISFCEHILAEADYMLKVASTTSREAFLSNETLKRAFVKPRNRKIASSVP